MENQNQEEENTIIPGHNDPVQMNEVMKDQKSSVEKIKARTRILLDIWQNSESYEKKSSLWCIDLEAIAYEFADLENDLNYVKDINTYVAKRYEWLWECLPSLKEIDELIKAVENIPAENEDFFCTDIKQNRLLKLQKLRSAIKADQR